MIDEKTIEELRYYRENPIQLNKSAREMFEELGYDLAYENKNIKKYLMAKHIPNRIDTKYINFTEIEFALNGIKIGSWQTNAYIERIKNFDYTFLTTDELKAINQQCKELGWQ